MAQAKTDIIPITELYNTIDAYATELGAVEVLGPCVRLSFTILQNTMHGDGKERIAVAKVILPIDVARQLTIDLPAMMAGLNARIVPEMRADLN